MYKKAESSGRYLCAPDQVSTKDGSLNYVVRTWLLITMVQNIVVVFIFECLLSLVKWLFHFLFIDEFCLKIDVCPFIFLCAFNYFLALACL